MADFYEDADRVDAYLAHRHAEVTSPNLVMEEPAFSDVVGPLPDLRVLDLGCGDGTFAAAALTAGCASFTGVDVSQHMIERARLTAPAATFVCGAIEDLAPGEPFDLVTSRMALHYLHELGPTFERVRSSLAPHGRFVFSVIHPVITAARHIEKGARTSQVVDNYFEPGPRHRQWFGAEVEWQHRTIEHYVTALHDAGFGLDSLRECEPVEPLFHGDRTEYQRRQRVPVFLLLAASAKRD